MKGENQPTPVTFGTHPGDHLHPYYQMGCVVYWGYINDGCRTGENPMGSLGGPEFLLFLVVVLLLFGVGRVSRVGGELGSAIREFRKGLQGGDEEKKSLGEGSGDSVI